MKKILDLQRGSNRKPLISAKELANEFGVSIEKLGSMIGKSSIPPPKKVFVSGHGSTRNSWYEPKEFRAWWKLVNKST